MDRVKEVAITAQIDKICMCNRDVRPSGLGIDFAKWARYEVSN